MADLQAFQKEIVECAQTYGHAVPTLVAVSKTKTVEDILEVYGQGQRIFGENYVQELIDKSTEIRNRGITDLEFHFIGHLQRNKVKALLPHIKMIHSIDSIRLLEEVDRIARELHWDGGALIQVNIDSEPTKTGFSPDDVSALASWIEKHSPFLRFQGLTCIPDPDQDPAHAFSRLRQLRDRFAGRVGTGLSMGMSSDYRVAIEHGSTYLRIGSAIFGAREKK